MSHKYHLERLVKEGVNFDSLFADKQDLVRKETGMAFGLNDVVTLIGSHTDSFSRHSPVAVDLDNAIYGIYLKSTGSDGKEAAGATPKPDGGGKGESTSEPSKPSKAKIQLAVRALEKQAERMKDSNPDGYRKRSLVIRALKKMAEKAE